MMAFETVTKATNLWIKGRGFTVERLLGPAYEDQAQNYIGGALGIFRLAPQVRSIARAAVHMRLRSFICLP